MGKNTGLALAYIMCELMNLGSIIVQIMLCHYYLQHQFIYYGFDVWTFNHELAKPESVDPSHRLFPRASTCKFQNTGPSGSRQMIYGYCLTPLNIIYDKIFLMLWMLYFALIITNILSLLCSLFAVISKGHQRYYIFLLLI
jgi:hypothetical protein